MKLRFGMYLDGWRAGAAVTRFDELTCGPLGLLNQLELRLGWPSPRASQARRVTMYRRAIQEATSSPGRFYAESVGRNPLAAAEALLGWPV